VVTLLELEKGIAQGEEILRSIRSVVFIQCVGSRDEDRPYCSRICCSDTMKCLLKLKELNPEVNIYVLYRDVRTYGFHEGEYRRAREKGAIFIRYEPERSPVVEKQGDNNSLKVRVFDQALGEELEIEVDLVALAVAALPPEDNLSLAQFFKVPLDSDGFFLEAHMKLRPVDFSSDGVFLCGLAHSPKTIDESITQALAASSRAALFLSKDKLISEGTVAYIDKNICSGCQICVNVCLFEAISFNDEEGVAEVNESTCKGCGNCAAACPSGACSVRGFEDRQIISQIEALGGVA